MKDSKLTDAWVAKMVESNPMTILPNGAIRTCPVRLAFAALFEPRRPARGDAPDKPKSWGAALLFPPGAEAGINNVLYAQWIETVRAKFPKQFGADGRPFGLHWPVHPCAEKQQLAGYTPGLHYLDASSRFAPDVVDSAMNPITDPERAYSGVWGIAILRVYVYDNLKRGAGFGLQGVMIVADDEKLYRPGIDAGVAFAGVTIDAAYDPAKQFGAGPAQSVLPPAVPVSPAPPWPGAPPAPRAPAAPPVPQSSYEDLI